MRVNFERFTKRTLSALHPWWPRLRRQEQCELLQRVLRVAMKPNNAQVATEELEVVASSKVTSLPERASFLTVHAHRVVHSLASTDAVPIGYLPGDACLPCILPCYLNLNRKLQNQSKMVLASICERPGIPKYPRN